MCLGIPGKLVAIDRSSVPRMGTVEFGKISKRVCIELVPEVEVGMYVIVHVGFALSMLNEEEAKITLALLDSLSRMPEE